MKCLPLLQCHFLHFLHSLQQFSHMDLLSAFNVFQTLHSTEIITHFFLLCSFLSPTHTYMPVLLLFMANSLANFSVLFYMLHYLRGLCLLFLELLVCSLLLHSVCFLLTSPSTHMYTNVHTFVT